MCQWFFRKIPAFHAEVGFKTEFDVQSETRSFRHIWKLTEVVPFEKMVIDWSYQEYPGRGLVEFALSGGGDQTKLTLTNYVLEDFPEDIPEFRRESCVGGWKVLLSCRTTL